MKQIYVEDISILAKFLLASVETGLTKSYENPNFSQAYNPYIPAQHSARLILRMFRHSDKNEETVFRQAYSLARNLPSFKIMPYWKEWLHFTRILAEQLDEPAILPMSIGPYTRQSGLNQFVKYGQMNQNAVQHFKKHSS